MVAALVLVAGATPAAEVPAFQELKWTEPGAEYAALFSKPPTCLEYNYDTESLVPAGEALFNTPALLGGQAAKAGLSCASCHANGRNNPYFLLTGVSGKAGSADVTNSFFSAARGNGKFDPAVIPDLAIPGKVPREPTNRALETFIRSLIVEEFGGSEPSPATLKSLAAYVRAIRTCRDDEISNGVRRFYDQWGILHGAMASAMMFAAENDIGETRRLIAAARHQLALLSERYAGPQLKRERAMLLNASRDLQKIGNLTDAKAINAAIYSWQYRFATVTVARLAATEENSLYNPDLLAKIFPPMKAAASNP